jgi:peptide/nickel transport system permease protein
VLTYLLFKADALPPSGYCPMVADRQADCSGLGQWAYHLLLPWIVLGYLLVAVHAVVIRRLSNGIARAGSEPTADRAEAVAAARRHRRVAYGKMVARNWFWLIGATLFVEATLGYRGLGLTALQFANAGDLAGLQAVILFTSLMAFGGWLVVDLIGAAVSPHWREL